MTSMDALKRKENAAPANSKVSPAKRGPGTQAIFVIDWATPSIFPCSLMGDFFEMNPGMTVCTRAPEPRAISPKATKNINML